MTNRSVGHSLASVEPATESVVTLRPIVAADPPAVAAAVDASRDALRRWMAWYRDDYDVQATRWQADRVRDG